MILRGEAKRIKKIDTDGRGIRLKRILPIDPPSVSASLTAGVLESV
ncbi:MAG: hypothetical protein OHK0032_17580 [Thermodesulfovibrionales bacterium]